MSRSQLTFVALATPFLLSFTPPIGGRARAQDVLLDIQSPAPGAGASIGIAIGDWDGDGLGDIAIGAPRDSTPASQAGAVRIHSGKDGSILATFYGVNADDFLGNALARMPDLDGDGIDDLAVAAPYADFAGTDTGSVYLYAGRTGALLLRIDGPATSVHFGNTLGALDDVDGDGIPDLFVGNFGGDDNLRVRSGADGHEIATLQGPAGEVFGYEPSMVDDLDGDGVRELLIGAPGHRDSRGQVVGAAYVVSPVSGAILRTHAGTYAGEGLGLTTAALADLDGDGVHDYAVAADYDDLHLAAMVLVFSGATGAQLGKITTPNLGPEILNAVVADAGDLNGDGIGDLAVGGMWTNQTGYGGAAFLFSGKNFLELDRIETQSCISVYLAPFGDLNGDGFDDLLVGRYDLTIDGEVFLFSGDDLWLNITPRQALPGDVVQFNTREGPTGNLTLLALEAIDGTPTFQIVGGVRSFGALGGNKQSGKVPAGLSGHDFTFRAYANDASGKVIKSAVQTLSCR